MRVRCCLLALAVLTGSLADCGCGGRSAIEDFPKEDLGKPDLTKLGGTDMQTKISEKNQGGAKKK